MDHFTRTSTFSSFVLDTVERRLDEEDRQPRSISSSLGFSSSENVNSSVSSPLQFSSSEIRTSPFSETKKELLQYYNEKRNEVASRKTKSRAMKIFSQLKKKVKEVLCPGSKITSKSRNNASLKLSSIGGVYLRQEDDPVFLLREVNKYKGNLSAINAAFENQEKNLKELNEELDICKEQLKMESELKNEALTQKTALERSFQLKSKQLVKSTAECSRFQERTMSLAKELAALKLISNLNLEEEQVASLDSIGNETNSKATADILAKSLVISNKTYNKPMAQYNLVNIGESRALKKYEKAKEKMNKLKARVIELELASEERENAALRYLKASKAPGKLDAPVNTKFLPVIKLNQTNGTAEFHKDLSLNSDTKVKNVVDVDLEKDTSIGLDDINCDCPQPLHEQTSTSKVQSDNCFDDDMARTVIDDTDDDSVHVDNPDESSGDDIVQIHPFQIRKEASDPVHISLRSH